MRKPVANETAGSLMMLLQVVTTVVLSGCAASPQIPVAVQSTTPSPAATSSAWGLSGSADAVARAHGLRIVRLIMSREATLPASLDDSDWGPVQATLSGEGYDLRPYAGRRYRFSSYGILDKSGAPMSKKLIYLDSDGRCIGAYLIEPGEIPGPHRLP
jgi:hypothetical protein